jgi:hypothetical protein
MNDEDVIAVGNALDADERALGVHEAGHAVVAHGLGAEVLFVEIDIGTGNGWSRSSTFDDNTKNLAVCVAGYKAELAFAADEQRLANMFAREGRLAGDSKQMQELLLRFPEATRLAALVEGFTLADVTLKANADVVHRIADALFSRRFADKARIEGDELTALLSGVTGGISLC